MNCLLLEHNILYVGNRMAALSEKVHPVLAIGRFGAAFIFFQKGPRHILSVDLSPCPVIPYH